VKPVLGKQMCKALEAHGWALARIKSSPHLYVHEGSPLRISVPVHGNRDLPPGTQRTIMRRAGLTNDDF
jgi:predicted RNA binding protein YcfA (HicA-like mRNA interferase family)